MVFSISLYLFLHLVFILLEVSHGQHTIISKCIHDYKTIENNFVKDVSRVSIVKKTFIRIF